jgi:hypothetical protein
VFVVVFFVLLLVYYQLWGEENMDESKNESKTNALEYLVSVIGKQIQDENQNLFHILSSRMDATDRKIQALEVTTNRLLEVVETFAHGNKELEEEVKHFVEDAYKSLQPTVHETPAPVVSPIESVPEATKSVEEEMKPAKLEEPVAEELVVEESVTEAPVTEEPKPVFGNPFAEIFQHEESAPVEKVSERATSGALMSDDVQEHRGFSPHDLLARLSAKKIETPSESEPEPEPEAAKGTRKLGDMEFRHFLSERQKLDEL